MIKTVNIFIGPNTIESVKVLCDRSTIEESKNATSVEEFEDFEIIDILDKMDEEK